MVNYGFSSRRHLMRMILDMQTRLRPYRVNKLTDGQSASLRVSEPFPELLQRVDGIKMFGELGAFDVQANG